MLPKIVLFIIAAGIGVVILAVVLKSVLGGNRAEQAKEPEPPVVESAPTPVATPQMTAVSSNNAAFLDQLHATEVAKELDQVRELMAAGIDPNTTALLLGKVTSREPEVRKAALEGLRQLNDTNAIPGLQQAVTMIEDPREKVAFMDVIEYLKLPEATTPATDVTGTNATAADQVPKIAARAPNPKLQSGAMAKRKARGRQAAPVAAPPETPATPAAKPQ